MEDFPSWLPPLVLFSKYEGNWERYLEAIYNYFKQDFLDNRPSFRGRRLGLKKHPLEQGKEATFWHFIQEGPNEDDRIPDIRRCERIRWPKPVIENADKSVIKIWENKRKNDKRILLWLEGQEYLVVLAERKGYLLPWTAYLVIEEHRKKKLQKEYEASKNANAAF
ncbi:MAG: hypothetical protein A2Y81_05810 [Nitrospirae bacterium RBG_13_43_8]|nr:MAG: hypothetical protein A2Y81_05810 [Nitrospirae bacterium RBG_13_43_8]